MVSDGYLTGSSANFSTNRTSYQRVCGRAKGYQKGETVGFYAYQHRVQGTIDGYYADGLLLTYGSPRQHIWTYVTGLHDDRIRTCCSCPYSVGEGPASPPFVGTNYYCESGTVKTHSFSAYYFNDPLWDGSDCTIALTVALTPSYHGSTKS